MTLERIAELRALIKKATPAPWFCPTRPEVLDYRGLPDGTLRSAQMPSEYRPASECVGFESLLKDNYSYSDTSFKRLEDAEFTSAARGALPEALDALERVRRACSFDASAYLDTEWSGGNGKGMPVVPVADILAALEGKK